jgi:hypothetical protein
MTKGLRVFYCIIFILTVSCQEPDFDIHSCLGEKYTYEELDFFYQTGFLAKTKRILKWREDITISIVEGATEEGYRWLDSMIAEINPLIHPLSIKRVENNGKIKVRISKTFKGQKKDSLFGNVRPTLNGYSITGVNLWVSTVPTGNDRKDILRHEMMHALGFDHTANLTANDSVLGRRYLSVDDYENRALLYDRFSSLDKAIIRIMYQECIPERLSRDEFGKQLKQLKKKLNAEKAKREFIMRP